MNTLARVICGGVRRYLPRDLRVEMGIALLLAVSPIFIDP